MASLNIQSVCSHCGRQSDSHQQVFCDCGASLNPAFEGDSPRERIGLGGCLAGLLVVLGATFAIGVALLAGYSGRTLNAVDRPLQLVAAAWAALSIATVISLLSKRPEGLSVAKAALWAMVLSGLLFAAHPWLTADFWQQTYILGPLDGRSARALYWLFETLAPTAIWLAGAFYLHTSRRVEAIYSER